MSYSAFLEMYHDNRWINLNTIIDSNNHQKPLPIFWRGYDFINYPLSNLIRGEKLFFQDETNMKKYQLSTEIFSFMMEKENIVNAFLWVLNDCIVQNALYKALSFYEWNKAMEDNVSCLDDMFHSAVCVALDSKITDDYQHNITNNLRLVIVEDDYKLIIPE